MDKAQFEHLTVHDQVHVVDTTGQGRLKDIISIDRDNGIIYTKDGSRYNYENVDPHYDNY